jgi:hypothetical protein
MSTRHWSGSRGRLLAAFCVILTVATGCRRLGGNVETIRYGREFTPDGERLRIASRQPRCGCISLTNTSEQRVWLEAWLYGTPRGAMVFPPGEKRRIMFDWAGSENTDFYELVTFKLAKDDRGRETRDDSADGGLRIRDILTEHAPFVHLSCNDDTCEFGSLSMNHVFLENIGQVDGATRQRGVNVSSVIEVAAPLNRCGCMMTRNISPASSITLQARLNGTPTGQLTLPAGATVPIPFDWAGRLDTDVYVIEIVALDAPAATGAEPPATAGAGQAGQSEAELPGHAMTIRLRDYVTVVGQLLDMDCTPEHAEFTPSTARAAAPPPATPSEPLGGPAPLTNVIQCPWLPGGNPVLGMFKAYDPDRTRVQRTPLPGQ